jgi:hypothetical protein
MVYIGYFLNMLYGKYPAIHVHLDMHSSISICVYLNIANELGLGSLAHSYLIDHHP